MEELGKTREEICRKSQNQTSNEKRENYVYDIFEFREKEASTTHHKF